MEKFRVVKKTKVTFDKTHISYLVQKMTVIGWHTIDFFYDDQKAIDYCNYLMFNPIITEEVIYPKKDYEDNKKEGIQS
jgi:hypothetical protein